MNTPVQPILPNAEPIPGYRLLERLGRGGYGEVWKCEAPGGILKAIKFVFGDIEGFGNAGEGAEQEYRSLNRVKTIRHPFILSLERFDIINGQLLIVTELADRNLWDRFNECVLSGLPGIPHDELYKYLEEAAEALDLMNGHYQIQHMDIKPQNIFLVHNHIKVADFGLAKDLEGARAAMTGGVTPTYAPPETFEGWVSRHSDQYSLAIVYQEMLTGRRPFNGTNTRQLIMQHMTAAPDLSPLNENSRPAVARALSKVPTDRFPTCMDFVKALKSNNNPPPASEAPTGQIREAVTPRSTAKGITPQVMTPRDRAAETSEGNIPTIPRKMPALITPGNREKPQLITPTTRNLAKTDEPKLNGGTTAALNEVRGNGCLFPALFIGLGGIGLKALSAIRSELSLKFGRDRLPNVRFLAVDTDPISIEQFLGESSWESDEVLLTKIQRASHYLQHESLKNLDTWLPNGILYQLPRSSLTEGNRALGRLAFCDHYRLIRPRIRSLLSSLIQSDCLQQADKLTQLGIRGNMPRVYILGSMTGGTGSGMAIDFAYLVKKELQSLGANPNHLVGIFSWPTHRRTEVFQNAVAALRELAHFDIPSNSYSASFASREPEIRENERPFRRCELIPNNSKATFNPNVMAARMATLTVAEAFSQAGRTIHPDDAATSANSICVPSISRIVWPYQFLTDLTVSRLSKAILLEWAGPANWALRDYLRPLLESIWLERSLQPEQLFQLFEDSAQNEFQTSTLDMIAGWLQPFRVSDRRNPREADDLLNVVFQINELLGRMGSEEEEQNLGKLAKLFRSTAKAWLTESDSRLITSIVSLIEQPGMRLPAAELLVRFLEERIGIEIESVDRRIGRLEEELVGEYTQLFSLSSSSMSGRTTRLSKKITSGDHSFSEVMGLVKSRIELLMLRRVADFYKDLLKQIPEYVREIGICRKQLHAYAEKISEPTPPVFKDPECSRFYFGERADQLSKIADEILLAFTPEHRQELEQNLQAKIRHEGRGLVKVCVRHQELGVVFMNLVREQTRRIVELVVTDYGSRFATWEENGQVQLTKLLTETFHQFANVSASLRPSITVAGLPAEDREHRLLQFAKETTSGIPFVPLEIPGELWVQRECRGLTPETILIDPASDKTSNSDIELSATKQSRFDISWAPLNC